MFSYFRYALYMEIAGIGYCAIRGCDGLAVTLADEIALCGRHLDMLMQVLKPPPAPPNPFREVVYYVTWLGDDSRVKIGTSTRLRTRMHALSAGPKGRAHLLAAEPGSFSVERKRHREFRFSRSPGTELFRLTPQIREHIAGIQAQWPQWLELSGVGPEWLP